MPVPLMPVTAVRLPRLSALALIAVVTPLGGLGAQSDASPALDAVTIQGRPGFMESYKKIVDGEEVAGIAGLQNVLEEYAGDPDVFILRYNVACGYARLGRSTQALKWLDEAVRDGYGVQVRQVENLSLDEDLKSLRTTEQFGKILEFAQRRSHRIQNEWSEMRAPYLHAPVTDEPAKPRPVLLLFHSYGNNPETFASYFKEFADAEGFLLVAPTGTRLIADGRWAFAVSSEDMVTRFRMDHREGLLALQAARKEYAVDNERIYACGLGPGAALAYSFAVRNPQVVKGGVGINGGYAPSTTKDWLEKFAKSNRRVLLLHAEDNQFFPLDPLKAYAREMKDRGLGVRLTTFGGGHGLPRDLTQRLRDAVKWIDGAGE